MESRKKDSAAERERALLRGGLRGRMAGGFCTLQGSVDALQRYLAANTTPGVYEVARTMLDQMTGRIAALERISGNAAELACGVLTWGAGELAPLELSEYLAESLGCINEELAIRGFNVRAEMADHSAPVWTMATTGLVDGILVNLLSNLIQVCPGGRMTLRLGPGRTLTYRDDGPGMDHGTASRLLEEGKVPERMLDQGSVGLLMVREYALAMNWTIHVEDGNGLCIQFNLPEFDAAAAIRSVLWDAAAEGRGRTAMLSDRLKRELDGAFGPYTGTSASEKG